MKLIEKLAFTSSGLLSPLAAFMGGLVAQECLKGISHKFIPIRQWYMPDAAEVIPASSSVADFIPAQQSRTSLNQICIGQALLDRIASQRFDSYLLHLFKVILNLCQVIHGWCGSSGV